MHVLEKVLAKKDASVATFGTRTIHAARSGRIGSGRTCSTVGWNRVRAMRVARTTRTVHGSRRVRFRRPTPARRSRAFRGCRSFGTRAHAPRALRARCGGFAAAARGSAAAAPLRLRRRRACRGSAAAIPRGVRSSRLRRRLSAFLMRCSSSSFSFPSSSGSCSSPSRPTRRGRHPPRP